MQCAGRVFSSKTSKPPPTLEFFFLAMLFSNHQDGDEGWFDLFFHQLLQLYSLLYFVSSEHPVFSQHHSYLGQFIFLKYQSPLSSSRVSASTALSPQVQKLFRSFRSIVLWPGRVHNLVHPLGTSSLSRPLTLQLCPLAPVFSDIFLTSCWGVMTLLSSQLLSSYDLCNILLTGGDELNLAHRLRQATKCPLKIPPEL